MLSREYGVLAGAGGVKDMVRQLARSMARWNGRSVSVVLPCYGFMDPEALGFSQLVDPLAVTRPLEYEVDMDYVRQERREQIRVWTARQERVTLYLLDSARFREKLGVYTYTSADQQISSSQKQGQGHYDYFAMNVLLQKGALNLMLLLGAQPDIIHCHDAHTALVPAMIRENEGLRHLFRRTGTLVTIHNAGLGYHQEVADLDFARAVTGLPMKLIRESCLGSDFDPFLAAAPYAHFNTVSENYARELQESDDDRLTGMLGHLLLERGVRLAGIINGIDPGEYDPVTPAQSGICAAFDPVAAGTLTGKELCRQELINRCGAGNQISGVRQGGTLHCPQNWPLLTFVGRLSEQKGIDLLLLAMEELLARDSEFVFLLLGTGALAEEQEVLKLAADHPGRVCVLLGYDPILANQIYAAGDFFLIPSRYEPCGLTDFMAQLFGNLPVVHAVGGLVKVLDGETGLSYDGDGVPPLVNAVERALTLYRTKPGQIRTMQRRAVQLIRDRYSWRRVMQQYLKLYKKASPGQFIEN
ncbi:MAG: glycogen/starch synthase [Desulfobulbaceae bacterium]|uniref:starch synthase n=1 Tax=Candidatus Desulfatifera sulfidica TaxID=2841691 RepID=A0A8J6NBK3_9BACT|nr:glycogen/starch synthase [Candidatus Desulfatifera sulfidica]